MNTGMCNELGQLKLNPELSIPKKNNVVLNQGQVEKGPGMERLKFCRKQRQNNWASSNFMRIYV